MNRAPRRPRRAARADTGRAVARSAAPARSRKPALSRRRFMSLLAAGSASALLAPAGAVATTAKAAAKPAAPASGPSPAMRAEIEKQKKSVADALKAIRDYALPAGSDMAFEFKPLGRRGK